MITATPSGNWREGANSPRIHNYLVESFTTASLAAVLAAVTGGVVGAILAVVAGAYYTSVWLSAQIWEYYNYTDYGFKVGYYSHSIIYVGFDGTGSELYEYTSGIKVR